MIETKLMHVSVPGHLFIANIIQNHDNRFPEPGTTISGFADSLKKKLNK
jgi:hypothetical protein